MDGAQNLCEDRLLLQALQKWMDRTDGIGAYLEYQIEGAGTGLSSGEERIARLLEETLPPVVEHCGRRDPSERWISLRVGIQPEELLLECASAGKFQLEPGRTPEDLKLPEAQRETLRHVCVHVLCRYRVLDEWAMEQKFPYLARQFEPAGRAIKNISLNAAFLAAGEDGPVTMRHLLDSVRNENLKLGKTMLQQDFAEYGGLYRKPSQ